MKDMMIPLQNKIIAIDFDGTIVENEYPEIGMPKMFAFETMKKMQANGYRLILWTVREGKSLQEAVSFCEQKGIVFYAVNKNYPEEIFNEKTNRKINADIFIDDRNIGGLVDWSTIHQLLFNQELKKQKKRFRLF